MFVTTLKGFIFLDESEHETEALVKHVVQRTLFGGEDLGPTMESKRLLAYFRDNIPHPMNSSVHEALRFINASVVIKRFELVKKEDIGTGEEGHPAWNVFIAPATNDHTALKDWIAKVRLVTFATEANGAGTSKRIYTCSICHSEGHPGGMCEFTKAPGWINPAPANSPALESLINATQTALATRPVIRKQVASAYPRGRGTNARGRSSTRA